MGRQETERFLSERFAEYPVTYLRPIPYHESSGELRRLYDEIKSDLNMALPPNWAIYLGQHVEQLSALWTPIRSLVRGSLPNLLLQLILFTVSRANLAAYCAEYHGTKVLQLVDHLSYDELLDISRGEGHAIIPPAYTVAIRITNRLTEERCVMSPKDYEELEQAGFSRQEICEIIFANSFAQLFNTYTVAANVPIDREYAISDFHL